jgi:hypothetical protein
MKKWNKGKREFSSTEAEILNPLNGKVTELGGKSAKVSAVSVQS